MGKNINKIAIELKDILKENFVDFEGLYLYGSQAKGLYLANSDIDLVALFKSVDKEKRKLIWRIVSKIEYDYGVDIDLHPLTKNELEKNGIYCKQVQQGVFFDAA